MALEPNISILIPAFKNKYLHDCISSILNQTYKNFEIIIVDDASPYDLHTIVGSFSDKRISYYRNQKGFGGKDVVKNWNKCLEYATGEFVICLGDDDRLLPNCLNDYVYLVNKYPNLDLYHMRTEIINERNDIIDLQEARPIYESALSLLLHRIRGRKQFIGDFMFRTNPLKNNNGFFELPSGCCSDDISAVIAASSKGVANTYRPGFQYRNNSQTLSNSSDNMRMKHEAFIKAKIWYENYLSTLSPNSELDALYRVFILNELNGYIYRNASYCIKKDIKKGGFKSACYWILNRKKFSINPFFVIRSLF